MSNLLNTTLDLLNTSTLSLREIADASGLPFEWLNSIKYERIKNPSVHRIEKLYEFLSGKHLQIK